MLRKVSLDLHSAQVMIEAVGGVVPHHRDPDQGHMVQGLFQGHPD